MKTSDTILVGFDHSNGDVAILVVGRKETEEMVTIVNQFQGEDAISLYKKLVGCSEKDSD